MAILKLKDNEGNIIPIPAIKGEDGRQVEMRCADNYLQWRYAGDKWRNLLALSLLVGSPGLTPYIGEDGLWHIGGQSTNVPATGPGVPAGGKPGQVLVKSSEADYETQWRNITDIGRA